MQVDLSPSKMRYPMAIAKKQFRLVHLILVQLCVAIWISAYYYYKRETLEIVDGRDVNTGETPLCSFVGFSAKVIGGVLAVLLIKRLLSLLPFWNRLALRSMFTSLIRVNPEKVTTEGETAGLTVLGEAATTCESSIDC
jgi:hypothetical protein